MTGWQELIALAAGQGLWTVLLLLARIAPAVLLLPVFGGLRASPTVRLAVAGCLVFACWPDSMVRAPDDPLATWVLTASQLTVGLTTAIAVLLLFEAVRITGALSDLALGRGSMGGVDPLGAGAQGPLATLHTLLFVALFAASGAHVLLIRAIASGLETFPLDRAIDVGAFQALVSSVVALSAAAIYAGIAFALPALAVAVIVDLSLGWLSRTLPGLPALFLAMPLRMVLGWIVVAAVLASALPMLLDATLEAVTVGLP